MCGIAGLVTRDHPVADPAALTRAFSHALGHRGPDGDGWWLSPAHDALLVHRRLAIIDLAPEAAQPMTTADGRHRIVFNGEVYNYRELKRELEARGERFSTESDTEVLLRLIALDGPTSLARVRGMFALASWDAAERMMLLARDRFGIKPLYLAGTPRRLAFASEISALVAARVVDPRPSPAGVLAFLSWGSVPPPLTWLDGVEAIAPGTWTRWGQDGRESRGRFADARAMYLTGHQPVEPPAEFRARVGEAIRDSVRAHLVADVPVGVFLSGGLDSSALVSAAVTAGASHLQTFTVVFDDPTSEGVAARRVADAFGTTHHELRVDAGHILNDFERIVSHLDQPTIDGVNSFFVARAVASTGIKAVLSGTGGDELFGGYPSFGRLPRAATAKRALGPLLPLAGRLAAPMVPSRFRARWRHFASSNGSLAEAYRVQRGFILPQEITALAGDRLRDRAVRESASAELGRAEAELLEPVGPESPTAGVARLESRLYLASQLLRDIDVMSMAHGLEVRVPLVDHQLTAAVWPALGFRRPLQRHKRLLSDTLARPLPADIVGRPKQGFTLPFARWIRGELAPLVCDGLGALAVEGWVRPDAPERVWTAWQAGSTHWSRPWGLSVLGHFLRAKGTR